MMTTFMNIFVICIYVYICTVVLSYTVAPNQILEMENSLRDQIDLDLEYEDHCDYIGMEDLSQLANYDSTLNVTHLNIRGIIGKQADLLKILNGYNGKTITHLATINETWLTSQNKNKLNINEYKCISKERVGRKGGGVCILAHDSLYYTELTEINDIHYTTFEHMCIEVKMRDKNLTVVTLYRPPNGNVTDFLEEYQTFLSHLNNLHPKNRIIIGTDHNLDLLKYGCHKPTQDFLDMNIDYNILPTITRPTRFCHTTATLLDNLLVSTDLVDKCDSTILTHDISDHLPCLLSIRDTISESKVITTITSRKLTKKAIESIRQDLTSYTQEGIEGTNESFNNFHTYLLNSLDKHAPTQTNKIGRKKTIKEPWITKGLKISSNIKLKLYKDSLLKKGNQEVRNRYTRYRNLYQRLCRKSRMAYYKEKCKECKTNTKKLWTIINQVIGKTNNKMDTIEAIKVDNILKHNPKEITNSLAQYFSNVGHLFSSKITNPNNPIDYYLKKIPRQQNSLFLSPTTPQEIMRLIEKLPNKKSSGHDGISNTLLKELKLELSIILCDIFNKSIQEGVFPDIMKLADVVPLYKSKAREEPTNYRPISLLLTLSKLLEKIIYKRTYEFLETNNSLFTSQYGFRSRHSCENAITEPLSTILKNKETKKHTMAVFLGGLSLHLNHLIGSRVTNYDWQFGTLPFGLFWSNLDTMDLETYPRTYSGQF